MRTNEPSDRNYAIFAAFEFDNISLRQLAAEHGISVGRVQQIIKQARSRYIANCPTWLENVPAVLKPFMAGDLFNEKLRALQRQAMDAWEGKLPPLVTRRRTEELMPGVGPEVVTTKSTARDPRYLQAAGRLAKMQWDNAMRLIDWEFKHQEQIDQALAAGKLKAAQHPYAPEAEEPEIAEENDDSTPYARETAQVAIADQETQCEEETDVVTLMLEKCEPINDLDHYMQNVPLPLPAPAAEKPSSARRDRKERRKRERKLKRAQSRRK